MSGGGTGGGTVRELLAAGRREEARRRFREARQAGRDPPDPEELGAARIGATTPGPDAGGGEAVTEGLAAWRLPGELGGGVLLLDTAGWRPGAALVDPDDVLVLGFGGIGAAVGSVPLTLHRRSPDGEVEVVLAWTFEVGPGSYGEPEEPPTPEDALAAVEVLLDEVAGAGGPSWLRFGELEREEWDRAAFLEHYAALARERGVEPMDPGTADRENYWVRYGDSVRHDTVEAFARDVFRAREAPRAGDDLLAEAAGQLAWMVREATGVEPTGLEVAPEGARFSVRAQGDELGAWPCTRDEWARLKADLREEDGGEAGDAGGRWVETLALRLAEELLEACRDGLEERLVELERRRLSGLVVDAVEARAREELAEVLPDGAELSAEVVELPRARRHGDPGEAGERGPPPYGVELRCWDPDAGATVPIEREPPDPDRLAREAAERLRSGLEDGGAGADDGR